MPATEGPLGNDEAARRLGACCGLRRAERQTPRRRSRAVSLAGCPDMDCGLIRLDAPWAPTQATAFVLKAALRSATKKALFGECPSQTLMKPTLETQSPPPAWQGLGLH